jgi:hypothetical protein
LSPVDLYLSIFYRATKRAPIIEHVCYPDVKIVPRMVSGFNSVVMSAEDTYYEQYVVHHLKNAPRVGAAVTLTSSDMIQF